MKTFLMTKRSYFKLAPIKLKAEYYVVIFCSFKSELIHILTLLRLVCSLEAPNFAIKPSKPNFHHRTQTPSSVSAFS